MKRRKETPLNGTEDARRDATDEATDGDTFERNGGREERRWRKSLRNEVHNANAVV